MDSTKFINKELHKKAKPPIKQGKKDNFYKKMASTKKKSLAIKVSTKRNHLL